LIMTPIFEKSMGKKRLVYTRSGKLRVGQST
jgi:hypothetical protein